MSGSRKRVTGMLSQAKRGLTLTTDDAELWIVETDDDVAQLLGKRIVVEGDTAGLDRLKAVWIGAVKP